MFKGTLLIVYAPQNILSYPERLSVLNLETLELRRLKADLVMYYTIINNLIVINFDDLFTTMRKPSTISTR